jgi:hypothetical protein
MVEYHVVTAYRAHRHELRPLSSALSVRSLLACFVSVCYLNCYMCVIGAAGNTINVECVRLGTIRRLWIT